MHSELSPQSIQKTQKLWSLRQIQSASFLAGPMAGCYFLGKNFAEMGFQEYAKWSFIGCIAGPLLLFTFIYSIPEQLTEQIRPIWVCLLTSGIIVSIAQNLQKHLIQEKIELGAERLSNWWCALMIITFVIIQIPIVFLFTILFRIIFNQPS